MSDFTGQFLRPLGNKVILDPDAAEDIFGSGILVRPENVKNKVYKAVVAAKGPGVFNDKTGDRMPIEVDQGDVVYFSAYAGTEITFAGHKYLIVDAKDLLAISPEAPKPADKAEVTA